MPFFSYVIIVLICHVIFVICVFTDNVVVGASEDSSLQPTMDSSLHNNNFPLESYPRSLYDNQNNRISYTGLGSIYNSNNNHNFSHGGGDMLIAPQTTTASNLPKPMVVKPVYDAPFFTAWILTISTIFFYPIHQLTVRFCSCMGRKGPKSMSRAISDAIQGFRERGMSAGEYRYL